MNLFLHGASEPKFYDYDTLSSDDKWGDKYECILANPPFMTPKGGIVPHNKFSIKSSKSEILFVDYIANHLTSQGKAGIIVPDGVVFKNEKAFVSVRKDLIENSLWGVISLPSGIFQPYAGVSTNILLLDKKLAKDNKTQLNNYGFTLTTQRKAIDGNEIPDLTKEILNYKHKNETEFSKIMVVNKEDIIKNGYDLSYSNYSSDDHIIREDIDYKEVYSNLRKINEEINQIIAEIGDLK